MGVIQRHEKRLHGHFSEPVQNALQTVGGPLVGLIVVLRRGQRLRTEQGLQGLADKPEREGGLSDIRPARSHHHPRSRQPQGVLEQC